VGEDAREALRARGDALGEAFFPDAARDYRARLRESEEAALAGLREASDIEDAAILRRLAGLGIRAETLAALTLIPLVEVAWADARLDRRERAAVLSGAESTGILAGSPSHGLLRLWLEERPAPDLALAWKEFIAALCRQLSDEERGRLRANLIGRARRVAEAAGGFLGLTDPVSAPERTVLEELEKAF
jgi:hypothetical protein